MQNEAKKKSGFSRCRVSGFSLSLALIISLIVALPLFSATSFGAIDPHIKATVDNAASPAVKIYVENKFMTLPDGGAYIENGRTMVPLRFISDALGAQVAWNSEAKKVTVTGNNTLIELTIGDNAGTIRSVTGSGGDTGSLTLETPPVIKNGRTYVPLRFVTEGLGATLNWDSQYFCVAINKEVPYVQVNIAKTIEQIWPDNVNMAVYKGFEDTTRRESYIEWANRNCITTEPVGQASTNLRFAFQNPIDESMLKLYLQYMLPNDWGKAYNNITAYISKYRMTNEYHGLGQYYSRYAWLSIFADNTCEILIYPESYVDKVHTDKTKPYKF